MIEQISRYELIDNARAQDIGRYARTLGEDLTWFSSRDGIGMSSAFSVEADRFMNTLLYVEGQLKLFSGDRHLMENGAVSESRVGYYERDSRHIGMLIDLVDGASEVHLFPADAYEKPRSGWSGAGF